MFDIRVIPELPSMILTLIAVLILFWGLSKLLYKPVSKILNERKEKIQNDIDSAKILKEEADKLRAEYEAKLLEARKESQGIIEAGRRRGEEIKENLIAEAKKEAESIIERAKREIQAEREKALLEVRIQAGEMAVLIASKIIEKNVDMVSQQELIEKFLDEVGTREWQN
ncbi:F0F1 ATP synthase subunit B [Tepidimicrobium xylanilyticum]|uniref:ATP synthase subunit b n=1 Tax=Tepidimicrobium xylanilyticum TaxID=1123352 RepID=A0A1H2R1I9_9FIRM|nr:F0F1 ATP synthase subunit B [Tepidimicrobium xylanilyticum]SDW12539.1 F-type H+-transporting ATPase subunit b [Tepidimicrobium xylanilyticum]